MYHYRNVKTGVVIKTHCKVSGKNWELAEDTDTKLPVGDTFQEDTFEEDTVEEEPDQTEEAEDDPVEKPQSSRRGKK